LVSRPVVGVEQVVEQVVGDVRERDPHERERVPAGGEMRMAHRQQARDRARGKRHRQDAGAG